VPPIPEAHRKELSHLYEWCWSTRDDIVAGNMYRFRYVDELLSGYVADYTAVSHSGHGINSYGLNVSIVTGPLALVFQHSWGGGYSNPTNDLIEIAACFSYMRSLIDSASTPETEDRSLRHVIAWSNFRGIADYYTRSGNEEWLKHTQESSHPIVRLDGDDRRSVDRETEPLDAACTRFLECITEEAGS
jgi:hypothetical protein